CTTGHRRIDLLGGFQSSSKVVRRLVLGGAGGLGCIRSMKERVMSVRSRRVVVAADAAAAAVAVPAAALASGSPSGTPAPSASARGLGVSPARLAAALGGVKQALAGR